MGSRIECAFTIAHYKGNAADIAEKFSHDNSQRPARTSAWTDLFGNALTSLSALDLQCEERAKGAAGVFSLLRTAGYGWNFVQLPKAAGVWIGAKPSDKTPFFDLNPGDQWRGCEGFCKCKFKIWANCAKRERREFQPVKTGLN